MKMEAVNKENKMEGENQCQKNEKQKQKRQNNHEEKKNEIKKDKRQQIQTKRQSKQCILIPVFAEAKPLASCLQTAFIIRVYTRKGEALSNTMQYASEIETKCEKEAQL